MIIKIYLIIVVLVAAVAILVFNSRGGREISQTPNQETKVSDEVVTAANPPGDSVTIPKVILSEPGFVMIHKAVGDDSGPIVMTGDLLPAGVSTNVVVKTGIVTKVGEGYFAMLHVDNGNGVFDNPGTDPPVYFGGQIVQEKFVIE